MNSSNNEQILFSINRLLFKVENRGVSVPVPEHSLRTQLILHFLEFFKHIEVFIHVYLSFYIKELSVPRS
jgi:hypothetical protein